MFNARFGATRRFLKEARRILIQVEENVAISMAIWKWKGSGAALSGCLFHASEFRSLQSGRKSRHAEPTGNDLLRICDVSALCALLAGSSSRTLLAASFPSTLRAASERSRLAAGPNGGWHRSPGPKLAFPEPQQVRFVDIRMCISYHLSGKNRELRCQGRNSNLASWR